MKDRDRGFFECKLSSLKRLKLDETGTYQQTNKNIVPASYLIALQVARTNKGHTIGEILVKPCILESVRLLLGEEESKKMKQISLSNDTIKNRIDEMSDNIKDILVSIICPPQRSSRFEINSEKPLRELGCFHKDREPRERISSQYSSLPRALRGHGWQPHCSFIPYTSSLAF